jgi:hypothetical protein
VDGADNVQVNQVGHFGSPSHCYTLETLACELAAVAATVPVRLPSAMPHDPESAPFPRLLLEPSLLPRDEWDFLQPVPLLGSPLPAPGG